MNRIRSFAGLAAIAILAGAASLRKPKPSITGTFLRVPGPTLLNWSSGTWSGFGNDPAAVIDNNGTASVGPGDAATDLGSGYNLTYIGDQYGNGSVNMTGGQFELRPKFLATRRAASAGVASSPNPLESTRQIPLSSLVPSMVATVNMT